MKRPLNSALKIKRRALKQKSIPYWVRLKVKRRL